MHIEPRCIDHHISTVRLMHVEEFESILPMWSRIKKRRRQFNGEVFGRLLYSIALRTIGRELDNVVGCISDRVVYILRASQD